MQSELDKVLAELYNSNKKLAEHLVEQKIISAEQIEKLLGNEQSLIGQLLLEERLILKYELKKALLEQQINGKKLGEILVKQKAISPEQLKKVLSRQSSKRFGIVKCENMSDLEHNSLICKIEQLERQQQVIAKYIATTKHQLDELSEQFNNENRAQLESQQEPSAVINQRQQHANFVSCQQESHQQPKQVHLSQYQLVFDKAGSRAVLMEALEQAQERLIIVCPWLNRNSIDADLMQKFRDCLIPAL